MMTTLLTSADPSFVDWLNLGVSSGTLLAVLGGGFWTWWKFLRFRQHKPKAKVVQTVSHRRLSPERVLVRVAIDIRNIGNVLLRLGDGILRVQQIHPCPPHVLDWIVQRKEESGQEFSEGDWPVVDERQINLEGHEIEPDEHEEILFDFILEKGVETIRVYSHRGTVKSRG